VISLDLEKMKQMQAQLYTSAAHAVFGDLGTEALKSLISGITQIHARLDPGLRSEPLALFVDATLQPSVVAGAVTHVNVLSNLTDELARASLGRLRGNGSLDITPLDRTKLMALSGTAVVYLLDAGSEKFIIGGKVYEVHNPLPGYPSVFCKPTFSSLQAALNDYRVRHAANATCYILQDAWYDDKRWWFKAKPESTMRRSLTQYLRGVLRDASVKPEQNVDESHPVDIHVQFTSTAQHAIIEIKWLGQSVNTATGDEATSYTNARALAGAKQLADYIDKTVQSSPHYGARGYLVVFDGRRSGLTIGMQTLESAKALGYKEVDIAYSPDYAATRNDFDPPMRMYLHPVLS
jgi:hypothetical protein